MANDREYEDITKQMHSDARRALNGRPHWNTRPAAPVEGLVRYDISMFGNGAVEMGGGEYVRFEQAVAIIGALQSDVTGSVSITEHLTQRAERAEADNAALTARVKELELQISVSKETAKIKRVEYLDLDQDHSELKADYAVSEAQLKAVRKALEATHEAISEYYRYQTGGEMRGSYDGKPERNALWKSMYKARAALEASHGE